jgi:transglutaminase-like putative cysteine protease
MRIRAGFQITYDCPAPTPMILGLSVHPTRRDDLVTPDWLKTDPHLEVRQYLDGFGNIYSRILAPAGRTVLSADFVISDDGRPRPVMSDAVQHPVEHLPDDTLVFLLPSRYCETDRMSDLAWSLFGQTKPGWHRVQAIVEHVHNHIQFGYEHARPTKGAFEAHTEAQGVCRDFAHLAITFCRAMNIPARYCTGYLSDIGVPPPLAVMDFCAWMEVYLSGRWFLFDPRNNQPRIGHILMARGRDAADVPLVHNFGAAHMADFQVRCDEMVEA